MSSKRPPKPKTEPEVEIEATETPAEVVAPPAIKRRKQHLTFSR